MSRTILATMVIAGTIAGVVGLRPSPALAVDARTDATFQVDCWIGMKFGDQPGQLIRGWICERQRPAVLAAPSPQPPFVGQQDVAATSAGSHHR